METPLDEYLENDMLCDKCSGEPMAYPLKTTSPPPWERTDGDVHG